MFLGVLFQKWRVRAQRRRLIRQEMKAFAEIDPALYKDIGLLPERFRDQAERLVDCRLRICSTQSDREVIGLTTSCPNQC